MTTYLVVELTTATAWSVDAESAADAAAQARVIADSIATDTPLSGEVDGAGCVPVTAGPVLYLPASKSPLKGPVVVFAQAGARNPSGEPELARVGPSEAQSPETAV